MTFQWAIHGLVNASYGSTWHAEADLPELLKKVFKEVVALGRGRDAPAADALLRRVDEQFKPDAEKVQIPGRRRYTIIINTPAAVCTSYQAAC